MHQALTWHGCHPKSLCRYLMFARISDLVTVVSLRPGG